MTEIDEKRLLKNFIIESLSKLWDSYNNRYKECISNFSEESVHDIRVSIRRLIALLEVVGKVIPNYYLNEAKKNLKTQLKAFNPLRDIQVQLIKLKELRLNYSFLESYILFLSENEKYRIQKIKQTLSELDMKELEGMIFFLKLNVKEKFRFSELNYDTLIELANNTYEYMFYLFKTASVDEMDTIHKMRLAFKKFRYTMEIVYPLFPKTAINLKGMKHLQNILGSIQDNRVFLNEVHLFYDHNPNVEPEDFSRFEDEIVNKRVEYLEELFSNNQLVESFWDPNNRKEFLIKKLESKKKKKKGKN